MTIMADSLACRISTGLGEFRNGENDGVGPLPQALPRTGTTGLSGWPNCCRSDRLQAS